MDEELFANMLGEWIGKGTTTVGDREAKISEYVNLELTDRENCLSYIRRSRITIGTHSVLHNELGYMRTDGMALLLSRGSFINLAWDCKLGYYVQIPDRSSSDTRAMIRKVKLPSRDRMIWDASMEVLDSRTGQWITHTAYTKFVSLTQTARQHDRNLSESELAVAAFAVL